MAKSIKVKPKRGRPATGKDPFVGVRLPTELISQIDAIAMKSKVTRSEAIRQLLEAGLSKKRPTKD